MRPWVGKLTTVALERNVPPRSSGLIVEDQLARRASGLVIASGGAWAAAYGRNLYVGSNIRQPDAVRPVADHQSPIISLAMSPDGKRLASGDYSGEIIVRDASDGRVLRRFHNPYVRKPWSSPATAACCLPGCTTAASSSGMPTRATCWERGPSATASTRWPSAPTARPWPWPWPSATASCGSGSPARAVSAATSAAITTKSCGWSGRATARAS